MEARNKPSLYLPLSGSIRMVWSLVSQVFCPMESAVVLTRGLYCQPALRSGTHRAAEASGEAFFSQPYRWPTTVPTNQAREAALGKVDIVLFSTFAFR